MKNNILISSVFFLVQFFIAHSMSQAQEPEPSATPFDMTFRADEDVVQPVRVEFSAGTLNTDVSSQPGRQGNAGLPSSTVRAIIHPYQYFYNPRTANHFLALPIDIEMGIDGRSSKPYFQRIDVPIASWSYDRDQGDFLRINLGQYRHAGAPQYSLGQQMPININSFNPINLEFFTKTYDDDHYHTIYKMQFALPFLASNDSAKLFQQAQQKFTPLMDSSQIPVALQNPNSYGYSYGMTMGLDIKQRFIFKYTQDAESYSADGVYEDGARAGANLFRVVRTTSLETRVDKLARRPNLGKVTAGIYWVKTTQTSMVGALEDASKANLYLNYGTVNMVGVKVTWEPAGMKQRRQVRAHTRGY